MAIDVQKVESLPADAGEFAVLIQNNGVAEPVAQLYSHDGSKPSKLECFPAEWASTNETRNGASMGKLYTSSEDLLFVGFARAQLGQALHMRLM